MYFVYPFCGVTQVEACASPTIMPAETEESASTANLSMQQEERALVTAQVIQGSEKLYLLGPGPFSNIEISILGCCFGTSTQNRAESFWNCVKKLFLDPKRTKFEKKINESSKGGRNPPGRKQENTHMLNKHNFMLNNYSTVKAPIEADTLQKTICCWSRPDLHRKTSPSC